MSTLIEKIIFKLNLQIISRVHSFFRNIYYRAAGMKIGEKTFLPRISVTWPHQVSLGKNCRLEHDIYFHYDGIHKPGPSIIIGDNSFVGFGCEFNITKRITIGYDCLIASGTKFIDHDHGMALDSPMRNQRSIEKEITIGNNVWLGVNVVVLKGVNIGSGAVVAAGAVVTKSIPENEIWGGIPAKKISERK